MGQQKKQDVPDTFQAAFKEKMKDTTGLGTDGLDIEAATRLIRENTFYRETLKTLLQEIVLKEPNLDGMTLKGAVDFLLKERTQLQDTLFDLQDRLAKIRRSVSSFETDYRRTGKVDEERLRKSNEHLGEAVQLIKKVL